MALYIRLLRDSAATQTNRVRVGAEVRAILGGAARASVGEPDRATWGLDDDGPDYDPEFDVDEEAWTP
jgi:hypothetical protein